MISVVLSTYNGEKYVIQQLNSLIAQTKQADEVLIMDDASTDNTYEIVSEFIKKNNLLNWKATKNENNVGWKTNFHRLLEQANGDIIFLCDQDDIWDLSKIEIMASILENEESIDLLACGYEPLYIGNTKHISKKIMREINDDGGISKICFSNTFLNVSRPGCTYAIKKRLFNNIEPFWDESVPHDAILWRSAILFGSAYSLNKKLIRWRRYNASSSNPYHDKKVYKNRYAKLLHFEINNIEDNISYLRNIAINICNKFKFDNEKEAISNILEFENDYHDILNKKKFMCILPYSLKNKQYFYSNKTPIKHFIYSVGALL